MIIPREIDSTKVVQVIEIKFLRGNGTKDDMCRLVTQYWSFNGELLAERDDFVKERE